MRLIFNKSTVSIKVRNGSIIGSGIFISPSQILTCRHVIGVERAIPVDELHIVFNQREKDFRKVVKIWFPEGDWQYRKDVAVLELEAPFNAGESIIKWSLEFPKIGEEVIFSGTRADSNVDMDEVVVTSVGTFEPSRGCYMLQDGCTRGFSGGLTLCDSEGDYVAVAMVIANYKEVPMRTWAIPVSIIQSAIQLGGYKLPLISEPRSETDSNNIEGYIDYLSKLRERHRINESFIDIKGTYVSNIKTHLEFSALEFLRRNIKNIRRDEQLKICILGNYGTGKTCLAIQFCYLSAIERKKNVNQGILPVYVQLRFWNDLPSEEEFIDHIVHNPDYPIQSYTEFYRGIRTGKIFFVLDGIDELTKSLDPVSSPGVIQRIPSMLPDDASFAILGRTSFFMNRSTIIDLFAISTDEVPPILAIQLEKENYQVVQLKPLIFDQIRNYVFDRCGDDAEFAYNLIQKNYDLPDLATRPVLLNMIVECIDDLKHLANDLEEDSEITSVDLYETYIVKWLRNQKHRSSLMVSVRFTLLEELALEMLEQGRLSIPYDWLLNFIRKHLRSEEAEDFLYDIANCTFLDLIGDDYEFSHKSFLEFFVARALANRIKAGPYAFSESPFRRYLSAGSSLNEIIDFLRDIMYGRVRRDPELLKKIYEWLDSPVDEDRNYAGHLIGHIAARSGNAEAIQLLTDAFEKEMAPWPKRSLALACGRSGQKNVMEDYLENYLPFNPHREVNLSYHLEYYGSLEQTILSLANHFCSSRHEFLRGVDIFTVRQIMNGEKPISKQDKHLTTRLNEILSDCEFDDKLIAKVKLLGVKKIAADLSVSHMEVPPKTDGK